MSRLPFVENRDIILKTLKSSSQPLKSGEIAEKSKVDKKEVDKIIKKLVVENIIISPKRCFYSVNK